jgi:hypothetical protein
MRRAYAFLVEVERSGRTFTREELVAASGWTPNTTEANLSKKLSQILHRENGVYRSSGAIDLGEEGFYRICSQKSALAADPRRPTLSQKTEELVIKARESVLAAVQHYNNPTSLFRSGNYLVLMIIGYTALFHAIFERDGVDYIERKNDRSPKLTKDGEPYHWDALHSARYYAQHYANRYDKHFLASVAENINLMLPIRNRVEHRHMPQLDLKICGHCQGMLIGFERILKQEFTNYYALNPSLSLALQFSTERSHEQAQALKHLQSAEYSELQEHISRFHANLPDEIAGNTAFEFRVWLVQKPANRERGSDMSIEFVPTDRLSREEYADLQQAIIAVKGVPSDFAKECNLWESEVVKRLIAELGAEVQFGEAQRKLNGAMIRDVRDAHGIVTPSKYYYRPGRADSRPMYSPAFVQWIVEQYRLDREFFYKAVQAKDAQRLTKQRIAR